MQLEFQKWTSTIRAERSAESESGRATFSHSSAAPKSGACTPVLRLDSITWRARSRRDARDRMEAGGAPRASERRQGGRGVRPLEDRAQLGAFAQRQRLQPAHDEPVGAVGLDRAGGEALAVVQEARAQLEDPQGLGGARRIAPGGSARLGASGGAQEIVRLALRGEERALELRRG